MKIFFWLSLIPLLLLQFSCSLQEKKTDSHTQEINMSSGTFSLTDDLLVKDFSIDTTGNGRKFKGVFLTFSITSNATVHKEIEKNGYSAIFMNAEIRQGGKVIYTFSNKEKAYYHSRILYNKGNFVSAPGTHFIDIAIPYFALRLASGKQPLEISIQAIPARFSADTTMHEYRELDYIGQTIFAQKEFEYTVFAPDLKATTLTVKGFELNKQRTKKSRFDFSIAGKGLPDLAWQLSCDDEVIFTSSPEKNSLTYDEIVKTPHFWFSPEDVFTISVYDYDKGLFNRKDGLGTWTGTMPELKKSKELAFGKITKFRFDLVEK